MPSTSRSLPVLPAATDCCSAVTDPTMDQPAAEQLARAFRALGDPARLRLLSLIAAGEDDEACICNLTEPLGLSQPTVSHHMKVLAEVGLVTREQRGKWAFYRIERGALDALGAALH